MRIRVEKMRQISRYTWVHISHVLAGLWSLGQRIWKHAEKIGAIVAIVGFPLIMLGGCLAWFQLKDYLAAPEIRLEFILIPGRELCVMARNPTTRLAKGVEVPISIWFDSWVSVPEVPLRNLVVHPRDYRGPNNLSNLYNLKDRLKTGDHLFGIAFANCPECERIHYYWLYYQQGGEGWYAEAPDDWAFRLTKLPPGIKSQGLPASTSYLVPNNTRIPLEEKVYTIR
jgi:hypothetical protein